MFIVKIFSWPLTCISFVSKGTLSIRECSCLWTKWAPRSQPFLTLTVTLRTRRAPSHVWPSQRPKLECHRTHRCENVPFCYILPADFSSNFEDKFKVIVLYLSSNFQLSIQSVQNLTKTANGEGVHWQILPLLSCWIPVRLRRHLVHTDCIQTQAPCATGWVY